MPIIDVSDFDQEDFRSFFADRDPWKPLHVAQGNWTWCTTSATVDFCDHPVRYVNKSSGQAGAFPSPCDSWRCRKCATDYADRLLAHLHTVLPADEILSESDEVWRREYDLPYYWSSNDHARILDRIRQMAGRRRDKGVRAHYLSVSRGSRLCLLSNVNLRGREDVPWDTISVNEALVYLQERALKLPFVQGVSGSEDGWKLARGRPFPSSGLNVVFGKWSEAKFSYCLERALSEIGRKSGTRPEPGDDLRKFGSSGEELAELMLIFEMEWDAVGSPGTEGDEV